MSALPSPDRSAPWANLRAGLLPAEVHWVFAALVGEARSLDNGRGGNGCRARPLPQSRTQTVARGSFLLERAESRLPPIDRPEQKPILCLKGSRLKMWLAASSMGSRL